MGWNQRQSAFAAHDAGVSEDSFDAYMLPRLVSDFVASCAWGFTLFDEIHESVVAVDIDQNSGGLAILSDEAGLAGGGNFSQEGRWLLLKLIGADKTTRGHDVAS
jgi:hypothetical protein